MINPELAERLIEAAAHMRKGVHTPTHVALMLARGGSGAWNTGTRGNGR